MVRPAVHADPSRKRSFISTVRPTVHTHPSRKRSFISTLGLPSTHIRHKNGAFRTKRSSNRKNLKTIKLACVAGRRRGGKLKAVESFSSSLTLARFASLLRSLFSGYHATLPPKRGERCVTSQQTAAKETNASRARFFPFSLDKFNAQYLLLILISTNIRLHPAAVCASGPCITVYPNLKTLALYFCVNGNILKRVPFENNDVTVIM